VKISLCRRPDFSIELFERLDLRHRNHVAPPKTADLTLNPL
jgi:hypothetical protein